MNDADAVYIPERLKRGATMPERLRSVLAIAEPLLGIDRRAGGRGYVRVLRAGRPRGDGWLYITASPDDTLMFPADAPPPLRNRPRYDWVDGPGGIKVGYLKPEARAMAAAPSLPPGLS